MSNALSYEQFEDLMQKWKDGVISEEVLDKAIFSGEYPNLDVAHALTDKELKKLETRIKDEYYIAQRDTRKKLQAYMQKFEDGKAKQKALLDAGEITKKEYKDWCYRHTMMGQQWKDMLNVLSEDYHHANEIALQMAQNKMPDIFALNANYATYLIEKDAKIDTGFTLYNHDTAVYLLGDQRQLMPKPSTKKAKEIAANKDLQWNQKKIQSAVLQGVLQGESPYDVAKRLQGVAQMNYNSAVRYARTMGTSAQNAGRYESYRRAKSLGVDLTIEWQATLDSRTRHEHRQMHGQRTEVDEPFHTPDGYTIYYPADCTGDSDAPQSEIWNCRCTLLAWVKGFEGETVKSSPKMGKKSFEEWQNEKKPVFTNKKNPSTIKEDKFSDERKMNALKFPDRYEADAYYRPLLDENWADMTELEKYGVWEYTSNSNPINKSLSGYHDDWSRSSYIGPENTDWGHENRWRSFDTERFTRDFGTNGHKDFHKAITSLTTGIEKNVLKDDLWLRRGGGYGGLASLAEGAGLDYDDVYNVLRRGSKQEKDSLRQLLIGQPCQEHSFLSTGIAEDAGFNKAVSYEIYAPKGTKAVYAEPQSYYGRTVGRNEEIYTIGQTYGGSVGGEAEVIIQRGSRYRITDIEFDDWGEAKVVMEVYDQPDYFKFGDEDTFNGGKTRHAK